MTTSRRLHKATNINPKMIRNHANLYMSITSQPFVRFTCFNFWLAALDLLYHFIIFDNPDCHTKGRLGWHQPSQAFFWYDTRYKISPVKTTEYNFYRRCYTKRKLRWAGDSQDIFLGMKFFLRLVFARHGSDGFNGKDLL